MRNSELDFFDFLPEYHQLTVGAKELLFEIYFDHDYEIAGGLYLESLASISVLENNSVHGTTTIRRRLNELNIAELIKLKKQYQSESKIIIGRVKGGIPYTFLHELIFSQSLKKGVDNNSKQVSTTAIKEVHKTLTQLIVEEFNERFNTKNKVTNRAKSIVSSLQEENPNVDLLEMYKWFCDNYESIKGLNSYPDIIRFKVFFNTIKRMYDGDKKSCGNDYIKVVNPGDIL